LTVSTPFADIERGRWLFFYVNTDQMSEKLPVDRKKEYLLRSGVVVERLPACCRTSRYSFSFVVFIPVGSLVFFSSRLNLEKRSLSFSFFGRYGGKKEGYPFTTENVVFSK